MNQSGIPGTHREISLRRLPKENLHSRPFRTAVLAIVVGVLTAVFFGGTMLALNLNNGLASLKNRLGADLMIVPKGAETQVENMLLTGSNPETLYFNTDIEAAIRQFPVVEQVTSQTYISSLSALCCSTEVQIVGFDPGTDFVIQPWIHSEFGGDITGDRVVAGSNITISADGTITFFNHRFPVAAQLAQTATGLDNSVFINRDFIPQLLEYSNLAGHPAIPDTSSGIASSAVLVKLSPDITPQKFADIVRAANIDSVGFVFPDGIAASTQDALGKLVSSVYLFVAVLWVLALGVLFAVFSNSVNERKRELATLRILGATRRMIGTMLCREALLIAGVGGATGIGLASLVIFPYNSYIGAHVRFPYLQVGVLPVLGVMLLALAVGMITAVGASLLVASRLNRSQIITVLREDD